MTEFRVLLEGGDVLVVDIHVEAGEEAEPVDPTTFGASLLNALGLGGSKAAARVPGTAARPPKIIRPVEPTAEEWLEMTSRDALRTMK